MSGPDRLDQKLARARARLDRLVEETDAALLWRRLQARVQEPALNRLEARVKRFEAGRSRPRLGDRKDLCLLLLYARGRAGQVAERIAGTTRMLKLLFLAQEEFGLASLVRNPYRFEPYRLGPFTPEVYDDLAILVRSGLVRAQELDEDGLPVIRYDREEEPGFSLNGKLTVFELTERGLEFGRALLESGKRRLADLEPKLEVLKARLGALSLRQLLRRIYAKYPEFTSESQIRDKLEEE